VFTPEHAPAVESMSLSFDPRWDKFRSQMPIAGRWAYFDHAAISPLPAPTRDAIAQWLDEAAVEGGAAWPRWDHRLNEVHSIAAAMIGASPEEIGLARSTTDGVTIVAEGYPWREGDNVVLPTDEFPTNQYPWLNLESRGVEVRRIQMERHIDLDRLEAACDQRTRLVAMSWVGFLSGWRSDLAAAAEMVHRRGALLFVDAIQGLGVFPLDVAKTGIDFFASGGQKWLMGPEGTGLVYIRREHLPRLRPLGVGWNSVVQRGDYTRIELNLKHAASRYEGGGPNSVGFIGLAASLELLGQLGAAAIGERILEINELCAGRLQSIGARIISPRSPRERLSGILTFELPACDQLALRKHCYSKNVVLAYRAGRLRISPHAYVNGEDIDWLISALEDGKKHCRQ
jgi:cysteine desulfurase / selenocysteine lyase